ncbi:RhuM family protein [Hominibacterium faecale]|uniref:RhuM family protein n=1 Tax=Hominibacterium faecale TaxID=2839743 RepID=UPI00300C4843
MAELFGRDIKTIGKHINNALREELSEENSVVAKFATTASDGKTYMTEHYNLDAIISVGYRVKSKRGVEFRVGKIYIPLVRRESCEFIVLCHKEP